MTYSVNVRTVAEFALERGDFAPDFSAVARMREGMEGHITLQREMDDTWKTEEVVMREIEINGIRLRVQGRADAVRRFDGKLTIEEIKTTSREPSQIEVDEYPAHWAQAQIYAWMISDKDGFESAEVALVYYNLNGNKARFLRNYTSDKLRELFFGYVEIYANWLAALEVWKRKFQPSVMSMGFPFDTYREGQRLMAANSYIAAREHRRLMIEAPTGIGKTAAALFGALKASGEGRATAIFYLTARTTGRRAAENAIELMRKKGLRCRAVTITAKEKMCVPKDMACSECKYAQGYFDRRRTALMNCMDTERLGENEIRDIAEEYTMCPFELSLDLAEIADVIICDYNYVFDLRIRLSRFFTRKSDCAILIDEAHNLPERARDMMSAEISGREIAKLRRELGKTDPLYKVLTKALKAFMATEDSEFETRSTPDDNFAIATDDLAEALESGIPKVHPNKKKLTRLLLDAVWYSKRHSDFDEAVSRFLISPDGKFLTVKIMCADPTKHIDDSLKKIGGTVFFSATLTPLPFYAKQLCVSEENGGAIVSLASPFKPENQLTIIANIAVNYKNREKTLDNMLDCLKAMIDSKTGNYIACFPSYAYLNIAHERFVQKFPDARCEKQTSKMSEKERADFLASFTDSPKESKLYFVTLGGVFAEGVDLPGDRLVGAAIITVGIPQIGQERDILREINDDGEGSGYDFAYVYPGFRRVMQAAGRVIRTETDKGVVILIDERFNDEKYTSMMPSTWILKPVSSYPDLKKALKDFWAKG